MSTDIKLELTTGDGINSFTTDNLNGELKAIILDCEESIELDIVSEIGYTIFNKRECNGIGYYPVRTLSSSTLGNEYTEYADLINLNEKLIITINGKPGIKLIIIFRF